MFIGRSIKITLAWLRSCNYLISCSIKSVSDYRITFIRQNGKTKRIKNANARARSIAADNLG